MSNTKFGLIFAGCSAALFVGWLFLVHYTEERREEPRRTLVKDLEEYVRDRRHYITYISLKVCEPKMTEAEWARYKQSFIVLNGEEKAIALTVSTYEVLEDLYDSVIDHEGGKISDELRFIRKAAKECRRLEEFTKRLSESSRCDIHYDSEYFVAQKKEIGHWLTMYHFQQAP